MTREQAINVGIYMDAEELRKSDPAAADEMLRCATEMGYEPIPFERAFGIPSEKRIDHLINKLHMCGR